MHCRRTGIDFGDQDWIRIRNSGGIYTIMFSEEIKEGGFIISPRVDFVVGVNILGGLMVSYFPPCSSFMRDSFSLGIPQPDQSCSKGTRVSSGCHHPSPVCGMAWQEAHHFLRFPRRAGQDVHPDQRIRPTGRLLSLFSLFLSTTTTN